MILQLNQDTNDFEATSMEYLLIKTLGLDFLTNKKNSTPYGEMRSWKNGDKEFWNYWACQLFE